MARTNANILNWKSGRYLSRIYLWLSNTDFIAQLKQSHKKKHGSKYTLYSLANKVISLSRCFAPNSIHRTTRFFCLLLPWTMQVSSLPFFWTTSNQIFPVTHGQLSSSVQGGNYCKHNYGTYIQCYIYCISAQSTLRDPINFWFESHSTPTYASPVTSHKLVSGVMPSLNPDQTGPNPKRKCHGGNCYCMHSKPGSQALLIIWVLKYTSNRPWLLSMNCECYLSFPM